MTDDTAAIFRRLPALKRSLGNKPNKDDRAAVVIGAYITEGLDTQARIVGALAALDSNREHVANALRRLAGDTPGAHLWRRGDDDRYRLLDEAYVACVLGVERCPLPPH